MRLSTPPPLGRRLSPWSPLAGVRRTVSTWIGTAAAVSRFCRTPTIAFVRSLLQFLFFLPLAFCDLSVEASGLAEEAEAKPPLVLARWRGGSACCRHRSPHLSSTQKLMASTRASLPRPWPSKLVDHREKQSLAPDSTAERGNRSEPSESIEAQGISPAGCSRIGSTTHCLDRVGRRYGRGQPLPIPIGGVCLKKALHNYLDFMIEV